MATEEIKLKNPKRKRKKLSSEHQLQTEFINWKTKSMEMQTDRKKRLALRWTHAVPNGFYRSIPARMKAKREGVTAGISDLCVPAPELAKGSRNSSAFHGLYIEMKVKGRPVRDEQREFLDYLDLVHYRNGVCYSWQCAAKLVVEHLGLTEYEPITEPEAEVVERIEKIVKKKRVKTSKAKTPTEH